jgi:alkylhydroperoxidase family enzyme
MTTTPTATSIRAERRTPLVQQLQREIKQLRERQAKLAALVDHYFGAYREATSLLERRDRELAQVRRLLQAKPIHSGR